MYADAAVLTQFRSAIRDWIDDCVALHDTAPNQTVASISEARMASKELKLFKKTISLHKKRGAQIAREARQYFSSIQYPSAPSSPISRRGTIGKLAAGMARAGRDSLRARKQQDRVARDELVAAIQQASVELDALSTRVDQVLLDLEQWVTETGPEPEDINEPAAATIVPAGRAVDADARSRLSELQAQHRQRQLSADEWREVGELLVEIGDRGQAIKAWRRALSLDPDVGIAKRLRQLEEQAKDL